jgi:hypothetical protein
MKRLGKRLFRSWEQLRTLEVPLHVAFAEVNPVRPRSHSPQLEVLEDRHLPSNGGLGIITPTVDIAPILSPTVATPVLTANDDYYTMTEGDMLQAGPNPPSGQSTNPSLPVDLSPYGVLYNDLAGPGDGPLVITDFTAPGNGTVAFNVADGSFTYTPNAGFFGQDSFQYTVSDGSSSATATVWITISAVPGTPPNANDDFYFTQAGVPFADNVLSNDSAPDGNSLTATLIKGPAHGKLTLNGDGTFIYEADPSFVGTDSFTYQAATVDANGNLLATGNVATVSLNVAEPAPTANSVTLSVAAGQTLDLTSADLLSAASDPLGLPMQVTQFSQAQNGTVTQDVAGFHYTPAAGFTGWDSFTYTVTDSNGQSAQGSVFILVGDGSSTGGPQGPYFPGPVFAIDPGPPSAHSGLGPVAGSLPGQSNKLPNTSGPSIAVPPLGLNGMSLRTEEISLGAHDLFAGHHSVALGTDLSGNALNKSGFWGQVLAAPFSSQSTLTDGDVHHHRHHHKHTHVAPAAIHSTRHVTPTDVKADHKYHGLARSAKHSDHLLDHLGGGLDKAHPAYFKFHIHHL